MSEIKPSDNHEVQTNPNKTWGVRLKSSLLIGLVLSGVWMVVVLAAGAYDPRGAAGMSGLLGNAFGIFVVLSIFTFVVKSIWHFFRKAKA